MASAQPQDSSMRPADARQARPPRPRKTPVRQLLARLRLWGSSTGHAKSGYKGQKRVLQRWKGPLERMRLTARARGDRTARIRLDGLLSPGIALKDGSLWVLPLGRTGRQEERQLRHGKAGQRARRQRRPDGLYFGPHSNGKLRLLKARRPVRGRNGS